MRTPALFLSSVGLLLLCLPRPAAAQPVISEVQWAGSDLSTTDEWVELACVGENGATPCTLSGWTLTVLNSSGIEKPIVRFGSGSSMESGAVLLVSRLNEASSRLAAEADVVTTQVSLPNTKLLLRLRDAAGRVRDQADDGIGAPFAGSNDAAGKASMERLELTASGGLIGNWRTAVQSVGFDAGLAIFGSPGTRNDPPPPPPALPDDPTGVTATIDGHLLELSWTPAAGIAAQRLYFDPALPDGTTVIAVPESQSQWQGIIGTLVHYLVRLVSVGQDGRESGGIDILVEPLMESESSTSSSSIFSSSAPPSTDASSAPSAEYSSASDDPALSSSSLALNEDASSSMASASSVVFAESSVPASSVSSSASAGSSLNASSSVASPHSSSSSSSSSSLGSSAHSPASSEARVTIQELLPDPPADGEEWVELRNEGEEEVPLQGWSLQIGTAKYALDAAGVLPARGFVVLTASRFGLRLSNAGATVAVLQGSRQADALTYGAAVDGVSSGRDADGQIRPFCTPSPGAENVIVPPAVSLDLQSGSWQGEGSVSPNVQALAVPAQPAGHCRFSFGDGTVSESCNPAAHSYGPGDYLLSLSYTDYCGTTVERTQQIQVSTTGTEGESRDDEEATGTSGGIAVTRCTPTVASGIRIEAALPDPEGSDETGEWIELKSTLATAAPLCGWRLADDDGAAYALDALSIAPQGTVRVQRTTSRISLNNDGDSLTLTAPDGTVQQVDYAKAPAGAVFRRGADGEYAWDEPGQHQDEHPEDSTGSISATVLQVLPDFRLLLALADGRTLTGSLLHLQFPDASALPRRFSPHIFELLESIRALLEKKKFELKLYSSKKQETTGIGLFQEGHDIALELLRHGWARTGSGASALYGKAEEDAKERHAGTWGLGGLERWWRKQKALPHGMRNDPSILLSEIHPSGEGGEWIELWNPNREAVDLAGWLLDDAEAIGSKPHRIGSGTIIQPESYLLISGKALGVGLNDNEDSMRLLHPDGSISDAVTYDGMKKGQSLSRVQDAWCISAEPTPLAQNSCSEGKVVPAVLGKTVVVSAKTVKAVGKAVAAKAKKVVTAKKATVKAGKAGAGSGAYAALLGVVGKADVQPDGASFPFWIIVIVSGIAALLAIVYRIARK